LYDWSKNFLWKITTGSSVESAENIIFHVNYGAAVSVDTLFVTNHNFDGFDITWQYSTNNVDWSNAVTGWTQSGDDDIVKELSSSVSARYWRLTVDGADLECGEIIMGLAQEFRIQVNPTPRHSDLSNVVWSPSVSGQERSVKLGEKRPVWTYLVRIDSTDLTTLQTILDDLDDYSLPLLLCDKEGDWALARLQSVPSLDFLLENNRRVDVDLSFVKMV
jgi:hypothetical protein